MRNLSPLLLLSLLPFFAACSSHPFTGPEEGLVQGGVVHSFSINEGYSSELAQNNLYLGRVVSKTSENLTPTAYPYRRLRKEYEALYSMDAGSSLPAWKVLVAIQRTNVGDQGSSGVSLPELVVPVWTADGRNIAVGGFLNLATRGSNASGFIEILRTQGQAYSEGYPACLPPDSDLLGIVVGVNATHIFPDAAAYKRVVQDGESVAGRYFANTFDEKNSLEYIVDVNCPRGVRRVAIVMPGDAPFRKGSTVSVQTFGFPMDGYAQLSSPTPPKSGNYRRIESVE